MITRYVAYHVAFIRCAQRTACVKGCPFFRRIGVRSVDQNAHQRTTNEDLNVVADMIVSTCIQNNDITVVNYGIQDGPVSRVRYSELYVDTIRATVEQSHIFDFTRSPGTTAQITACYRRSKQRGWQHRGR